MKRVMAIGAAATVLFVWLEVGAAQQASTLRFRATAAGDLRTSTSRRRSAPGRSVSAR
jgi:hypothetical protein